MQFLQQYNYANGLVHFNVVPDVKLKPFLIKLTKFQVALAASLVLLHVKALKDSIASQVSLSQESEESLNTDVRILILSANEPDTLYKMVKVLSNEVNALY
ncbi:hypothetical protein MIR68_000508 [Amoeboaphelidium protococcarum]|nr:hypothetical protein MIR68_000508 [Amoeboaphelidium protococcarum]